MSVFLSLLCAWFYGFCIGYCVAEWDEENRRKREKKGEKERMNLMKVEGIRDALLKEENGDKDAVILNLISVALYRVRVSSPTCAVRPDKAGEILFNDYQDAMVGEL